MNEMGSNWHGAHVVVGEIQDNLICVRGRRGERFQMLKDAPFYIRAIFLERIFADTNHVADLPRVRTSRTQDIYTYGKGVCRDHKQ